MVNVVCFSQSVHSPLTDVFSTAYNFVYSAAHRSEQNRLSESVSVFIALKQNPQICVSRTNSLLQLALQKYRVSLPMRYVASPKISMRLGASHFGQLRPWSCCSNIWSNRQSWLQKIIVCQRRCEPFTFIWRTHSTHFKRNDSRRSSKLMSICSFVLIGILYFAVKIKIEIETICN